MVYHALHYPDQDPSEFFMFPNIKMLLGGQWFSLKRETIYINAYLAKKDGNNYVGGLKKLSKSDLSIAGKRFNLWDYVESRNLISVFSK